MKRLLIAFLLPLALLAQQNTNVQKKTDGTNLVTAPVTLPAGSLWHGNTIGSGYGGAGTVNGILQADGAGNVSSFTIAPTNSQACYVGKNGNDSTGNGSIFAPYLTIGAALSSITDATAAKYYQVVIGPGTYTENVVLKPAITLVGSNGGGSTEAGPVRINGTITLDSSYATNNGRSGLSNIACLSNVTFDLTVPGGAISCTIECFNFSCLGNFIYKGRTTQDTLFWNVGFVIGTSSITTGNATFTDIQFVGNWSAQDSLAGATLQSYYACFFVNGTQTISSTSQAIVRLFDCPGLLSSLSMSGIGTSVTADVVSIPYNSGLSITGGATLTRLSDAVGLNYAPSTSSNWNTIPSVVNAALDGLASSGVVKTQAANSLFGNDTGSTALPSFSTLSAYLDNAIGSTHGELAVRGASSWGGVPLTTNGQVLIGSTGATPAAGTIGGTANQVNVANGAGSITLSLIGPYTPATYTSHGFLFGAGTSSITASAEPSNGQIPIGNTGSVPTLATITGTQDNLTVTNGAGSITIAPVNQSNAATAGQQPVATTRTYITGTDLHFTAGFLKVGTILSWHFDMTKTAAGIATSTFDIAFGTTGTTTDTARVSFTKPAGTAAADEGWVDISCVVKTNSSSGVVLGEFRMIHNLSATGHMVIPCAAVSTTSSTFNTTTPTDVGICITTGASDAITINQVESHAYNIQ